MRIVSGKYKGHRIDVPKNLKARPTTDFAKENLFNILSNQLDFEQLDVLDLYSGTGSIAFEFLSRGCKSVDIVECNPLHIRFINKTIEKLKAENIRIYRGYAEKILKRLITDYDIVFADPPYDLKGVDILPELVFNLNRLRPGGLFILEHSSSYNFSTHTFFKEQRKYGSVHFSFFEKKRDFF